MQPASEISPWLTPERLQSAATPALQWLRRSIEVHQERGSAAYRHLWRGWAPAYPETTGYLIETLFDYHQRRGEENLRQLAVSCADWLLTLQRPDGSFPGGAGEKGAPIVFDTAQILFGLTRTYAETGAERYLKSAEKAVHWLLTLQQKADAWKQYAYVPGYEPAYYTRVIWALLYANQYLQDAGLRQAMQQTIQVYAEWITPQQSVRNWGFMPGVPAFTHTIAYTLEGFLETAVLLEDGELLARSIALAQRLLEERRRHGRLAGAYDENWKGNFRFVCLTGNAQCSVLFSRLFEITGTEIYRAEAQWLLESVLKKQKPGGALTGSSPIWGDYMPFRYPNWAVKFLLDAITGMTGH